ncbi:hypothetical protein HY524_01900 [Candidatus Berkelbacteria bacterium]|nr:hypothetical protein [Candidatus Berkelbacteria bacterium]
MVIRDSGTVSETGSTPILNVRGRTVSLSRRSGVHFPALASGDEVTVTGVIVETSPIRLRILDDQSIVVTQTAPNSESTIPVAARPVSEPDQHEPATTHRQPVEAARLPQAAVPPLPLQAIALTVSQVTTLLIGRQVLVQTLSTLVTRKSEQPFVPVSPFIPLLSGLAGALSGLALLWLHADLLWQYLLRRVNGP